MGLDGPVYCALSYDYIMAASSGVLKVGVPSLVLPIESDGSCLLQITGGGLLCACSVRFSLLLRDAVELDCELCFFCLPFMSFSGCWGLPVRIWSEWLREKQK